MEASYTFPVKNILDLDRAGSDRIILFGDTPEVACVPHAVIIASDGSSEFGDRSDSSDSSDSNESNDFNNSS